MTNFKCFVSLLRACANERGGGGGGGVVVPRVPLVCKAKSRICNSSKGRVMRRMMIQAGSQFLPVK